MSPLPSGIVTFLFTDVERSTQMWDRFPECMRAALARHDTLIAEIAQKHNGKVLKDRGEGDSQFLTFESAVDAAHAALAIQNALRAEIWPAETPLKVRMALHTGEASERDGDYYGGPVNRCARVRAVGHGGQILLSEVTAGLAREHLTNGACLRDMGLHHLKDLQRPEHLFELRDVAWTEEFGSLRSLAAFKHNLPLQLTSFVGRKQELKDIRQLLTQTRLLTLLGSGGCGKTRLSLQMAAEVTDEYPNGVWFVELAPIAEGELVTRAIANAMGIKEEPGREVLQTLCAELREQALLLVLDNCEHLAQPVARIAQKLLQSCPNLRILASSRVRLNVAGEVSWRVPSLPVPAEDAALDVENASHYASLSLFVERALFARSDFVLTEVNLPAVTRICRRLEGIPLAIELAAARVGALTPQQIDTRLNNRFKLLVGGVGEKRHQTLSALIDWSHDLLSANERILLRRLSVFVGGWTLEAAETGCEWGELEAGDVLDVLSSLVDASLVIAEEQDGAQRYHLLESVREYAAKRLEEANEIAAMREAHLRCFLALAEEAAPKLSGAEQAQWLECLEAEHDNLRAGLAWATGETRLRLACALYSFWYMRSYFFEGINWLQGTLDQCPADCPAFCAAAFNALGNLLMYSSRYPEARTTLEEALRLRREGGDEAGVAETLNCLATTLRGQNNLEEAERCYNDSLELRRKLQDVCGIAGTLNNLGILARDRKDLAKAKSYFEESLHFYAHVKDDAKMAITLINLGVICESQQNCDGARQFYEQALLVCQQQKNHRLTAHILYNLGSAALQQQAHAESLNYFTQSVGIRWELGIEGEVVSSLLAIAGVLAKRGQGNPAAILLGVVAKQQNNVTLDAEDQQDFAKHHAIAQAVTAAETFARSYALGQEMSLQQAVRSILTGDFEAL